MKHKSLALATVLLAVGIALSAWGDSTTLSISHAGATVSGASAQHALATGTSPAPTRLARPLPFKRYRPNGENTLAADVNGPPICSSPHVSYFDGPLISNVHVVPVFWNSNVNFQVMANLPQFYSDVTVSNWYDLLSEYSSVGGTNQSIGRGNSVAGVTLSPTICPSNTRSCALTDAEVQNELTRDIQLGKLPAPQYDSGGNPNTLYAIHFPPNITLTGPGGLVSCEGFCAYHSTGTYNLLPCPIPP